MNESLHPSPAFPNQPPPSPQEEESKGNSLPKLTVPAHTGSSEERGDLNPGLSKSTMYGLSVLLCYPSDSGICQNESGLISCLHKCDVSFDSSLPFNEIFFPFESWEITLINYPTALTNEPTSFSLGP